VAAINNYVPKESVYYFTRKQPFQDKPKLPIEMAKPLHQLVMSVRIGKSLLKFNINFYRVNFLFLSKSVLRLFLIDL